MDLISLKTVIRTKDYEASKKFYTKILTLEVVKEYNSKNRGCILKFSDTNHALLEISEIPKGHDYHHPSFDKSLINDKIDIQIETDDIHYWAKHLDDKWEIRGPIDRPWGSQYLYLRDPDGLQIIIYQEKPKR
ncbi:VOC family protein [Aquimarina sp. M1]